MVLPDDVAVIMAPAVVHVEVVIVWIETPIGTIVTVVMTLSTYANEAFVLGTPEEYPTWTISFVTEPWEFVILTA